MIRFRVINSSGRDAGWDVEPLAAGVVVRPSSVLIIDLDHPSDLHFEVTINADHVSVWPSTDTRQARGEILLPHRVTLDGELLFGERPD